MLKLGYICGDDSGPAYHDIMIPNKFFKKYELFDTKTAGVLSIEQLKDRDIVIFQRQYAPESYFLVQQLKKAGKTCIFLVDDNVWGLPESNPAYSTYQGLVLQRYEMVCGACHGAITSTEYLRQEILAHTTQKNVEVLRNLVDPDIPKFKSLGRDEPDIVRVGWTGTAHHHDDILLVEKAIWRLNEVYNRQPGTKKRIKWIFMGYAPPNANQNLIGEEMEYYDFVTVKDFYEAFSNLDFDIGIAPLDDNAFNAGKTGRKAQEYGILSIPMVLSPLNPYKEWSHGIDCLKAVGNTPAEWFRQVSRLIDSPELRAELGTAGYKHSFEQHNINTFISERADSLMKIHKIAQGEL